MKLILKFIIFLNLIFLKNFAFDILNRKYLDEYFKNEKYGELINYYLINKTISNDKDLNDNNLLREALANLIIELVKKKSIKSFNEVIKILNLLEKNGFIEKILKNKDILSFSEENLKPLEIEILEYIQKGERKERYIISGIVIVCSIAVYFIYKKIRNLEIKKKLKNKNLTLKKRLFFLEKYLKNLSKRSISDINLKTKIFLEKNNFYSKTKIFFKNRLSDEIINNKKINEMVLNYIINLVIRYY